MLHSPAWNSTHVNRNVPKFYLPIFSILRFSNVGIFLLFSSVLFDPTMNTMKTVKAVHFTGISSVLPNDLFNP